tara:strand:- start:1018 stop:1980 length:963 start_codon:yes stop_codon:yes gene_type:complete
MFKILNLEKKIEHNLGDIENIKHLNSLVDELKPDFIFHLAAQSLVSMSYENPISTIKTNVLGTANILESLKVSNHKCSAIIITSDKCYKNLEWPWGYKESDELGGEDIYSGSKGAAEILINSYYHSYFKNSDSNVSLSSVRAGNVIGGGDWALNRIIPDCVKAWSKNKIVEIRSPNSTRPWQHVLEPLSGYLLLGQNLSNNSNKYNGSSYNFGPSSQYNITVEKVISDLSKIWGFKSNEHAFKIVGDKTFHEASLLKLNCDKALLDLNWLPSLGYKQLLKFTGDWYIKYIRDDTDMYNLTLSQISEYRSYAKRRGISWIN